MPVQSGDSMPSSGQDSIYLRTRASLIDRVKGNADEGSWHEFYETYWRAVYGYACRFGADKTSAEDIVQEVFIKVFRNLPSFEYDRGVGRFLSWIKTITRTTVMDWHRRRRVRVEGHIAERKDDSSQDQCGEMADPEMPEPPDPWREEWEESLLVLALDRVRERVKPETAQAFELYALRGQPVGKVAGLCGISVNSVYVTKSRMLKQLQAEVRLLKEQAG